MGKMNGKPTAEMPLPANVDAEESLLGSAILDPSVMDEVASVVRPSDFLSPSDGRLWSAMLDLHEAGRLDTTLLVNELRKRSHFDEIGGAARLAKLARAVPHSAHAIYYANVVREAATKRSLIALSSDIAASCLDPTTEAREVANDADQRIHDLLSVHSAGARTVREALHDAIDRIEARENGAAEAGVKTGFSDFDSMTGGLRESQLIVLAGRPGMGKSAAAMDFALNIASEGEPVLFVSLEMSEAELTERMLSSRAGVNGHRLRNGSTSPEDKRNLRETAAKLTEIPLHLVDTPGMKVAEIAAKARLTRRKAGKLSLVVIDYLQLIEPDNDRDPREQQVSKISRRLKALARQLKCPVLCLAQLNRQTEAARDNRPRLSHLRESGAIEQDADVVIFVHREEYYAETDDNRGKADFIIAKQRSGPTGNCEVLWQSSYTRFVDKAPERFAEFDDYNRGDVAYEVSEF